MEHCVSIIVKIIARNECDRRSILQLGYNLGRMSELSGLGREPFWDRWKDAVAAWDRGELEQLAQELQVWFSGLVSSASSPGNASPT